MATAKTEARFIVLRLTLQEAIDVGAALDYVVADVACNVPEVVRCQALSKHVEDTIVLAKLAARRRRKS